MDKSLEEKLEGMMRTIKVGFDEVHEKIDTLSTKVDGLEEKMLIKTEFQNTKQEIFDKISDAKYEVMGKVNDHEVRIGKLETNIA